MKKKVLLLLVVLAGCFALGGTEAYASIKDVRIYINPGHGSWGSEDRHLGTVTHGGATYTDTCGFYESNTNLWKGFGMLEKLIEMGVPFDRSKNQSNSNLARRGAALDLSQTNIVMSRVKNGPYPHDGSTYNAYSRSLSEIAAEVEAWGADMFIAIHSNAFTEGTTTNYPIFLYRGTDSEVRAGDSKTIGQKCWPYIIENPHMMWTSYTSSMNVRGDVTFMGSDGGVKNSSSGKTYYGYYGVLKHGTQGFLVEGYFHTYQPARHKAMNPDVCRIEGAAYARGIRDYFGAGNTISTGDIYGILRDGENTFTHTYYKPNTNTDDKYKPINNATVTLKKTDGTVVATYMTDDEYNGAFVFNKVTPGTYNIVCSHPDYADVTTSVTVKADKVVYPSVKITEGEQIPVQGHYAYDLSMTQNGDDYTLKFKSTGAVDNASIIVTNKSTGAKQSITIGKVVKGENTKTINAYDLGAAATFSWAVALNNPKSSGIQLIKEDNTMATAMSGKNMGLSIDNDPESSNFGKVYISAAGKGLKSYNQDLSDNGNMILSSDFAAMEYNCRLTVNDGKVYVASNDADKKGIWMYDPSASSTTLSNVVGNQPRNVTFLGTGANRKMYAGLYNYSSNTNTQLARFDIGSANTCSATPAKLPVYTLVNGKGDLVGTSKGIFMAQTRDAGNNTSDHPVFVFINESGSVLFNSSTLNSTLNGSTGGAIAISHDLSVFAVVDASEVVQVYNVSWNGNTPSFSHLHSFALSGTTQVDQIAFDRANNLYVASAEKGLQVYTIKNPSRQTVTPAKSSSTIQGKVLPAVPGQYAYGLTMTQNGDNYTLKFNSTGAIENAKIVFTNTATSETIEEELGAVVKGENTFTVNAYDFGTTDQYTWAVEFENPANPTNQQIHSDNSIVYNDGSNNARIGVAIDKDLESPNFGTIYTITGKGKGIQRFNQDYSKNGSFVKDGMFGLENNTTVRSNRLKVSDQKVYIANYSSTNSGVTIYNPNNGNHATILNGMYERAVGFSGSGTNRKMYVFNDVSLRRYDIGAGDTWTGNTDAPSATYDIGMINADGDILVTDKGIFASQHRYKGNNTSDVPVFVVVDYNGSVLFNSSKLSSVLTGSQIGGMAITKDLSTFVAVDGYTEGNIADVEIDIFNVTWNGNTPSFTHKYSIPLPETKQIDQMEFDHAGNLVIASRQQGLLVYAIKGDARTTVTPAKSTMVIVGKYVPGTEGHFAYDLETEETSEGYTLKFKSTGDVDNAKIVFTEVDTETKAVATNEIEIGVVEGENSFSVMAADLPYGTQTWAVVLENAASEGAEVIKSDASVAFENKAQGGVAVDKDTESANFGKIYTVTAYAQGLQEFDASMNPVGERLFKGTPFIDAWYSPYRVTANSGKLYMNDWIDSNSGVYVYDPNAETVSAPNMFVGTRPDDGAGIMINENGETVTCNVSSVAFVGEGEGRKMYAFAEDAVNGAPAGSLLRYDLGTADTWAVAPSATFSSMSSLLSTMDVVLLATENGIICVQKSENSNTAEKPAFVVVDFDGNVVYNSSALTDLNGSMGAAVAMYGNIFAIVNADGDIEVYNVAWNNNVPSFSDRYVIALRNTKQITQMDFDTAGNLYAFSVEEGLLKIAVKNEARVTRTDAKSAQQLVNSILTAIENVGADATAVKYFNLQGIEVEKPENGVFIKLQGNKASKVVL